MKSGDPVEPRKNHENIENIDLKTALEDRYISYALSTIMNRALPDVRDGLKPVHRRIIHAMRELRLNPDRSLAKCARIVGEVMGKFHPHGDQSIYDALVRMAQDFSMRYPLVEGQGNFGNIDGDNAAAMRYTEARMTSICMALLEGADEDAVDFRLTYNEEDEEPVVLPGAFPNLLANGSSGIAVGMATSIPPHNIGELCNAALHLIANPGSDVEDLMSVSSDIRHPEKDKLRGPDFPTGGVIIDDQESIIRAYKTGRGSFRVRAKWEVENSKAANYRIVVTEIPYGVQKSRLIEKIAELLLARKIPLLEDVRDESTEEIRLVLVPKNRNIDAGVLMESLFRQTDLESRFPLNMNVLSGGKIPRVFSLKEVIEEWLKHRCEVLGRRSRKRLGDIHRQLEILAGHMVACMKIDEVIKIIREEENPKPIMIARWSITELQAETILDLRLRQLKKLEEIEIRQKHQSLLDEKTQIEFLLSSESEQWRIIRQEIEKIRDSFGIQTSIGKRRTVFSSAPQIDDADIHSAMIEKELITLIISEKGWMRTVKGGVQDPSSLSFKESDSLRFLLPVWTTDKILLLTNKGKIYTVEATRIPGGRGHGEPARIILDMENDEHIVCTLVSEADGKFLLVSQQAYGFMAKGTDVVANTRRGKQLINLKDSDEAGLCVQANEGSHVAIISENRKMLIFSLDEIPIMSKGRGVRLQQLQRTKILAARVFHMEQGLAWKDSSERVFKKSSKELKPWLGKRGSVGRILPSDFQVWVEGQEKI